MAQLSKFILVIHDFIVSYSVGLNRLTIEQ